MTVFKMLDTTQEIYVHAVPTHFGAIPSDNLHEKNSSEKIIQFETCVFSGIHRIDSDGMLEIFSNNSDIPEFLHDHAEIKVIDRIDTFTGEITQLDDKVLYIPLFRPGYKIYGHWLIDILPRVILFKDKLPLHSLTFLLLNETPNWVTPLIETFFGSGFNIKVIESNTVYKGQIFISNSFRIHDIISKWSTIISNTDVVKNIEGNPQLPEKIHIVRGDNYSGRKLINKHELVLFLESVGFETVYPEKLEIIDQIKLFSSAKYIIGEAGSGLHNNIFAKNSAEIFVIQSSSQPHLIQSGLCHHMGQKATYIWAQSEIDDWFSPFKVDIHSVWKAIKHFIDIPYLEKSNGQEKMTIYKPDTHVFGPIFYIDFMKNIDIHCKPKSYFEIGTETGASVAAFSCASVCIDPQFKLSQNVIGSKSSLHLFQMPSDDFFAKFDLKSILNNGPDICFLDGMHRFEYLLRDFINIEKFCNRGSTVMIHDCYPLNNRMALRQHVIGDEAESESTRFGWTGDVWKIIPILKKYRPDLMIKILDVPPSGLVLINKLDPSSTILRDNYFDIVEEYRQLNLEEYGIEKLWNDFPFISAQILLDNPDELTTFFLHG